jgi:hypothetical protein
MARLSRRCSTAWRARTKVELREGGDEMSTVDVFSLKAWSNSLMDIETELLAHCAIGPNTRSSDAVAQSGERSKYSILRCRAPIRRHSGAWTKNSDYAWTEEAVTLPALRRFLGEVTLENSAMPGSVILVRTVGPTIFSFDTLRRDCPAHVYHLVRDLTTSELTAVSTQSHWNITRAPASDGYDFRCRPGSNVMGILFTELPLLQAYM